MLKRRRYKLEEQEQLIPLINEIRRDHPRMGARDIYVKLKPSCMGRDQFERFCMDSGYRIKPLKNYRITTNSLGVTRFPNLIKDKKFTGINQVFVSDITYYEIGPYTYYLTFIMDLVNREIVGWSVSNNLRTENTTIPALNMLIKTRGKANIKGAIFHSDGGGQYYSNEFKALTRELGLMNSMTESSVYENPHSERLNGIIKNNYLYPYGPKDEKSLKRLTNKAVIMYNTEKPHKALGKMTPIEYRNTIDNEDNSASYLPLSTANNHHNLNLKTTKKRLNSVNVI
jgi:transposase InsO family protein